MTNIVHTWNEKNGDGLGITLTGVRVSTEEMGGCSSKATIEVGVADTKYRAARRGTMAVTMEVEMEIKAEVTVVGANGTAVDTP